ncbi:MAG: DUF4264 family protein [Limnochordales bacterium]|nr:DUF4264 family protein [Limnochordales bacterium]
MRMGESVEQNRVYTRPVVLGSERLRLSGELHRLITFLNQTLAQDRLEFGLRKEEEGVYVLTLYRIEEFGIAR